METISLTIDGQTVLCPPGTTLWDAARASGIRIPTLCHHPDLKPAGACRICLVEDEKSGRMLASCVTPASPGMSIRTDSPTVLRHRANIVRLMMANHPESCIVCDQGNRCRLRAAAAELGVGRIDLYPMKRAFPLEEANPFIVRDLSKCIVCGRCVRADRELVVVGAIDYHFRGFETRPRTLGGQPLERSSCTFCGTCVSLCPTGALRTKTPGYAGSPETWSETVCGFCGVGCSLSLGTSDGRVVDVEPSPRPGTVNGAALCVRGHFEQDYLLSPDRLGVPLLDRDGEQNEVSWEEAVSTVVERLRSIREEHGPQSIAFWGSARCSVEENYLFQKIARCLVGTNNVGIFDGSGEKEALLGRAGSRTLADLERAEAILVLGANPTDSAPVMGYAMKRAARLRKTPMVVLDPTRIDLVPFSAAWLTVAPRQDGPVLDALAAALIERGTKPAALAAGWNDYAERLSGLDQSAVCRRSGVDSGSLERAADALQGKGIAFVIGRGILDHPGAEASLRALQNLALLTDSLEGKGRGVFFLPRENNREGALDMGACSSLLPGRLDLCDSADRTYWERVWGVRLSPDPGLNRARALDEMEKGNLKALYVMGENPLRELPQSERNRAALARLACLVVQDILMTETCRMAHVVLPGAAFSEKAGTFTNIEGRIQPFEAAAAPPGKARADWRILAQVYNDWAAASKTYATLEDVRKEIRSHVPGYENLKTAPAGTAPPAYRFEPDSKNRRGAPVFLAAASSRNDLDEREGYPFLAILGSPRCHMGAGTRTSRSRRIRELEENGELEMNPADCERMGVQAGETVRLVSRFGALERKVRPSPRVGPGFVFVPRGSLKNRAVDLAELTADGKIAPVCRVRIEKGERAAS